MSHPKFSFLKSKSKLSLTLIHLTEVPESSNETIYARGRNSSSFHKSENYVIRGYYKRVSLITSYRDENK